MEYTVFYVSIAVIWVIFLILIYFKPIRLSNIIIGITSIAYSLIYEIILGEYLKLYYYINPKNSILYIVISSIFLYAILNIVYTLFLPKKIINILIYTSLWIVMMLLFENATLLSKTIVFTGWKLVPWSITTYLFTYTWVFFFYTYLSKRVGPEGREK